MQKETFNTLVCMIYEEYKARSNSKWTQELVVTHYLIEHTNKGVPLENIITPEPNMKLTLYSDNNIKYLGSLHLTVKKKCQSSYQDTKFYLVDVTAPAIIGLLSCKQLENVKFNLDVINNRVKVTPQHQIKVIADLKLRFPDCFLFIYLGFYIPRLFSSHWMFYWCRKVIH